QPERRQRMEEQRDVAEHDVSEAPRPHGLVYAEREPESKVDDERRAREGERGRDGIRDGVGDRAMLGKRLSQLAMQEVAEIQHVLDRQRLIEAELADQPSDKLRNLLVLLVRAERSPRREA